MLAAEKPCHRLVEELQLRYGRIAEDDLLWLGERSGWLTAGLLAEIEAGVTNAGAESRTRVRELLDALGEIEQVLLWPTLREASGG